MARLFHVGSASCSAIWQEIAPSSFEEAQCGLREPAEARGSGASLGGTDPRFLDVVTVDDQGAVSGISEVLDHLVERYPWLTEAPESTSSSTMDSRLLTISNRQPRQRLRRTIWVPGNG
jgi:hypothetical protein